MRSPSRQNIRIFGLDRFIRETKKFFAKVEKTIIIRLEQTENVEYIYLSFETSLSFETYVMASFSRKE